MHSNVDTLTILTFKVRYQDSRYTYEKTDFFIHAAENSPLSNQISNPIGLILNIMFLKFINI